VSGQRSWDELVAAGKAAVANISRSKWELGDLSLEIAPLKQQGQYIDDESRKRLDKFASEIGLNGYSQLHDYRHVSSRWPDWTRVQSVSWAVHRTLMHQDDRHDLIRTRTKWTCRQAQTLVDERRDAAEKVRRIEQMRASRVAAARAHVDPTRYGHPDLPASVKAAVSAAVPRSISKVRLDVDDDTDASEPLTAEDFDSFDWVLRRLAFRLTQRPYAEWGADGLRLAIERLGTVSSALIGVEADLSSALAELESESEAT
jgi:hypothetical protein